jgi:hypothetical protein
VNYEIYVMDADGRNPLFSIRVGTAHHKAEKFTLTELRR